MTARFAAYYTPALDDPLFQAGAAWLGRDPETNATLTQPDLPDMLAITADPARYGFHATLKPPMRLTPGATWFELEDAARRMVRDIRPFTLPPLEIADIHGFLALRDTEPCPELQTLSDICVASLDPFRAQPSEAELAARRRGGLDAHQEKMLVRWGYPYVFETWFFHMTLTRRLSPQELEIYRPAAQAHFTGLLDRPRRITKICLFGQPPPQDGRQMPFTIASWIPLLG